MNLIRVTPPALALDGYLEFERAQRACTTDLLRIPVPDA